MTPDDHRSRPAAPRTSTLAEVLARRLAAVGLMWAYRWVLATLLIAIALGVFAAWVLLLVAIAWVGGLFGLTTGGRATPFVIGAIVISGLILFRPMRWAVRNLMRAEVALDTTIDRLRIPTTVDASPIVERRAITPTELAALDARLAASPSADGDVAGEPPVGPRPDRPV